MQDRKPGLPIKARDSAELEDEAENIILGNRAIKIYRKNYGSHGLFYLKNNAKNTPNNDLLLELEALVCSFYHFFCPSLNPTAHLYYYKPQPGKLYTDLATSELKEFLNLQEDKIKISDILYHRNAPEEEKLRVKNNVKGLALTLTLTALIFRGDDLNKKNLSKDGRRTDFGMAFWWVQSIYTSITESRPVNYTISEDCIRHFPRMSGEMPYHFPGPTSSVLPDGLFSFILDNTSFWDSAYRPEEKAIFARLSENKDFHYYKFLLLTHFIVTDPDVLLSLIPLYISQESIALSPKAGKRKETICEVIRQALEGIRENLTHELLKMPEFKEFMELHQTEVENAIIDHAENWNKTIHSKINKHPKYQQEYQACLINIEQTKETFIDLAKKADQIAAIAPGR